MAKKQDVTVVSEFVARAKFDVSGGEKIVDGKVVLKAVPEASFELEVRYEDMTELLKYAVPTTIIALQGNLRDYYRANGKFPVAVGARMKVKAAGTFEAPPTVHLDRLEAQVRAGGTISLADRIRLVKMAGLEVPAEWLAESTLPPEAAAAPIEQYIKALTDTERATLAAAVGIPNPSEASDDNEAIDNDDDGDDTEEPKYDEDELAKLSITRLRVLAQKEQLEGYDDLTKDELLGELAQLMK